MGAEDQSLVPVSGSSMSVEVLLGQHQPMSDTTEISWAADPVELHVCGGSAASRTNTRPPHEITAMAVATGINTLPAVGTAGDTFMRCRTRNAAAGLRGFNAPLLRSSGKLTGCTVQHLPTATHSSRMGDAIIINLRINNCIWFSLDRIGCQTNVPTSACIRWGIVEEEHVLRMHLKTIVDHHREGWPAVEQTAALEQLAVQTTERF